MNITQVGSLLDAIQASYPGKFKVEDPASLLHSWGKALQNHDFEKVSRNFEKHLESSVFPPTIADLVRIKPLDRINAIPNVDETRAYLDSSNDPKKFTAAQLQLIEQSKAEIRRILRLEP